ncbi:hypothetical protein EMIT0P265_930001 [Pseudomonas zeae]
MLTNDRNNPRMLEGIHEKIRAIARAKSLAQAQFDHGYQLSWIGALYWAISSTWTCATNWPPNSPTR